MSHLLCAESWLFPSYGVHVRERTVEETVCLQGFNSADLDSLPEDCFVNKDRGLSLARRFCK